MESLKESFHAENETCRVDGANVSSIRVCKTPKCSKSLNVSFSEMWMFLLFLTLLVVIVMQKQPWKMHARYAKRKCGGISVKRNSSQERPKNALACRRLTSRKTRINCYFFFMFIYSPALLRCPNLSSPSHLSLYFIGFAQEWDHLCTCL
jgi:hypothetical protein